MDVLAIQLVNPKDLEAFLRKYFEYEADAEEYHNLATESLNKVRGGRMVGDCDDGAHFAREIWRRPGYLATQVVGVPQHATFMRVGKKSDGTYVAETIGTYGYDIQTGGTLTEAVNKTLRKFEQANPSNPDPADLSEYQVKNETIEILDIPEKGKISIDFDIPLISLVGADSGILDEIREYEALIIQEDFAQASNMILDFAEKYKDRPSMRSFLSKTIKRMKALLKDNQDLAKQNKERFE